MNPQTIKRFWDKVDKSGDCWIWTGAKQRGYGIFRSKTASRISYELKFGPISPGLLACHRCDTPLCVNPDHLFLGTIAENNKDCVKKGRRPHGENHWISKLDEDQVKLIRYIWPALSVRKLGKLFNISHSVVGRIVKGDIWKSV